MTAPREGTATTSARRDTVRSASQSINQSCVLFIFKLMINLREPESGPCTVPRGQVAN